MKLLSSVLLITRNVSGQGGIRGSTLGLLPDFVDFSEESGPSSSSGLEFGGSDVVYKDYATGERARPNTEEFLAITTEDDTRGMGGPAYYAYNPANYGSTDYSLENYDTFDYEAESDYTYTDFNNVDGPDGAATSSAVVSAPSVAATLVDTSSKGRPESNNAESSQGKNFEASNPQDDGTSATRKCFTCSGNSLKQCRDSGSVQDCGGSGKDDTRDYCLIEIRQNQYANQLQQISMRCAEPADCHSVIHGNVQHSGVNPALHDNCRPKKDESGAQTYHWMGRYRYHQSVCRTCIHMSTGDEAGANGPGVNNVFFETGASPSFLKVYRYNGQANDFVTDNQGEANMLVWSLDMWNTELNLAFNKQLQTPANNIANLW